ncbi:hypothetical protein [Herbaspirillum sp. RV1423]|uniref:recombination directionality factor n=1 Tax=Herbaspirillum sp. RV1423 TaxID=1443993 RepID=UPI0004B4FE50|nr:hypothetical protein [Herbaspirillum sp. RV1423]
MLKGLAITPPVMGRISIGRVVEKNGKRLPEKDDQFTITSQIQSRDGWIPHPYDATLRHGPNASKLRMIPIRVLFNDPELNLRSEYCLFDRTNGRPLCAGNGKECRRYSDGQVKSLPCPSPDDCEFSGGLCKPYGRLNVKIDDEDDLGTFIFRTTGYNSIRNLTARLHYYQAVSGNRLACLPLQLQLRGKSTTQSHRAPIYYVDITIRDGLSLVDAITRAREEQQLRLDGGFDQEALDTAAAHGFANGAFENTAEEMVDIAEEFLLGQHGSAETGTKGETTKPSLADKLQNRIEQQSSG